MSKITVVYHSGYGHTKAVAEAVNEALDFMRRKLIEYKVADFLITLVE